MKFTAPRNDLIRELTLAGRFRSRSSLIPALTNLRLRVSKGVMWLEATCLDVWYRSSLPTAVGIEDGVRLVTIEPLLSALRAMTEDTVSVSSAEDSLDIELSASGLKVTVRGSASDWPKWPGLGKSKSVSLPVERIQEVIHRVAYAVCPDETRFQLNGALFTAQAGGMTVAATDGYRLSVVTTKTRGQSELRGLVPHKVLEAILNLERSGTGTLRFGLRFMSLKVGNLEIRSRLLEGSFPDFEKVLAAFSGKVRIVADRTAVERGCALAMAIGIRHLDLDVEGGAFRLEGKDPDSGDLGLELVDSEISGGRWNITLNPAFVADAASAAGTDRIEIVGSDDTSMVGIRPVGSIANLSHEQIVMPMSRP